MQLSTRQATVGDIDVLSLVGEIDLATLPVLRDALVRLVGDAPGRSVAVDLDGVTVLDDSGLGLILGAAGHARRSGGDLVVVCTSARLLADFDLSGLARAIEVRDRLTP